MKSSVISVANIQALSGRRPIDNFTNAPFRIGRISLDAICRTYVVWRGQVFLCVFGRARQNFPKPFISPTALPNSSMLARSAWWYASSMCLHILRISVHFTMFCNCLLVYPQQQASKVSPSTSCNVSSVCWTRVSLHLTMFSNCLLSSLILPN